MVQSELYYMITINQAPECEVPLKDVESGLHKYARDKGNRFMLAEEEGSKNGKAHFHLCIHLNKETRRDNVIRAIQSYTKVLKNKYSIDVRGTRGVPHKETWETYALDYVAKGLQYKTNMSDEFIKNKLKVKILKDKVEQRSCYIDKPKFWKLYRERLMDDSFSMFNRSRGASPEVVEIIRHSICEDIFSTYTPLWLKPETIATIVEFQERLHSYEERLQACVNKEIFGKFSPTQIEIVQRV